MIIYRVYYINIFYFSNENERQRRQKSYLTSLPRDDPRTDADKILLLDHHFQDVQTQDAGQMTLGLMIHALKGR